MDFRKDYDELTVMVQSVLKEDPFTRCRQVNGTFTERVTWSSRTFVPL
ncbi:transposase [Antarcticimicrobium luteum]|nr:transposase [Antarcticimicrobium luteum]